MLRDLAEFQRRMTGLSTIMSQARAAIPDRVMASDRTGAVTVELGPDGLPESIRFHENWSRLVPSEQLGDAVVEACRSGAAQRMTAWAEVMEPFQLVMPVQRRDGGPGWRPRSGLPVAGSSAALSAAATI